MKVLRRFVFIACGICALAAPAAAAAAGPLQTGVLDPQVYWAQRIPWPELDIPAGVAFARVRGRQNAGAGGSFVRLYMYWKSIAPTKPVDPLNPRDPAYRWADYDAQVRAARAKRVQVIFSIIFAPGWAETGDPPCGGNKGPPPCPRVDIPPGTWKPSADALGKFAFAAATRYSGAFDPTAADGIVNPLPRVRFWQAWNETNYYGFLNPQREAGANFSARWYRAMLRGFAAQIRRADAFYRATHRGARKALVVASSLAPFGSKNVTYPKRFIRKLLCLDGEPTAPCAEPVPFDVWAVHPYSHGSPSWHTAVDDNIAIADLPELKALLRQAHNRRMIETTGGKLRALWVTEFNWDAKPPDPCGAPLAYHARWTSEALYRFWQSGIRVAIWTQLRDYPRSYRDPSSGQTRYWYYQGGLYRWGSDLNGATDRPRVTLRAFRFPFVAYRGNGNVSIWGRTTFGIPRTVKLQRRTTRGGWHNFATVRTDRYGAFRRTFRTRMTGYRWVRAFTPRSDHSARFSLVRPRDLVLDHPFGC